MTLPGDPQLSAPAALVERMRALLAAEGPHAAFVAYTAQLNARFTTAGVSLAGLTEGQAWQAAVEQELAPHLPTFLAPSAWAGTAKRAYAPPVRVSRLVLETEAELRDYLQHPLSAVRARVLATHTAMGGGEEVEDPADPAAVAQVAARHARRARVEHLDPAWLRAWLAAQVSADVVQLALGALPRSVVEVGAVVAALEGMPPVTYVQYPGGPAVHTHGHRTNTPAARHPKLPGVRVGLAPGELLAVLPKRPDLTPAEVTAIVRHAGPSALLLWDRDGVPAHTRTLVAAAVWRQPGAELLLRLLALTRLSEAPETPRATVLQGLRELVAHPELPGLPEGVWTGLLRQPDLVQGLSVPARARLLELLPRDERLLLVTSMGQLPTAPGAGAPPPSVEPRPGRR